MRYAAQIFTLLFLLAQTNLPLYWHICTATREATFLASCKMCAPVEQPKSCCAKKADEKPGPKVADPVHSCCEIAFAQERAEGATTGSICTFDLPFGHGVPVSEIALPAGSIDPPRLSPEPFFSGESPPIYLFDSSFRI